MGSLAWFTSVKRLTAFLRRSTTFRRRRVWKVEITNLSRCRFQKLLTHEPEMPIFRFCSVAIQNPRKRSLELSLYLFICLYVFMFVFVSFDNDDERWETICLPGNDLGGFSSIGAQPPPGSASQPNLFLQISKYPKYPSPMNSCNYPNIPNIPVRLILAIIQIPQISQPNLFLQISKYHKYYSPTNS